MKVIKYLLIISLGSFGTSFAKTIVKISPLGESAKGQYIAYEEYGYHGSASLPFVKLKILNVWKNKYVEVFDRQGDATESLETIRKEIKTNSDLLFSKYSIVPIKNLKAF